MLYRVLKAVALLSLRLFYRVRVHAVTSDLAGPVILVGNHPNAMMDPALVGVSVSRRVTFLAKATLFRFPLGWLLDRLGVLPVYRRQDAGADMGRNEATFEAAAKALGQGRAITLFPEGKSHSEPALAELRTGCARIAFRACRQGAAVRIVPVGLTYSDKPRFRSEVLVELGAAIDAGAFLPADPGAEPEAVRRLTERIAEGLRAVTLNLKRWEDLPLLRTAEVLYVRRTGVDAQDADRLRRLARGVEVLRREDPERLARLRGEVAAFNRRLELVRSGPGDLPLAYRPAKVARFVARQLVSLLGLPLFAAGFLYFALPFWVPRGVAHLSRVSPDYQATVKLLTAFAFLPLWVLSTSVALGLWTGPGWGLLLGLGALPLALFSRRYFEGRREALGDIRTFFILGHRHGLRRRLAAEGDRIAAEIEALAEQYREPRASEGAAAR